MQRLPIFMGFMTILSLAACQAGGSLQGSLPQTTDSAGSSVAAPLAPNSSGSQPSSTPNGSAGSPGEPSHGGASGSSPTAAPATSAPSTGNPFADAVMYVNPDYSQAVQAARAAASPNAQALMQPLLTAPTAVWLDSLAAIAGGTANGGSRSLLQHLDAAVSQASSAGKPAVLVLVIYNLPNRDCKSLASNGELQGATGLQTYKTAYIDVIAQQLQAKPAYRDLRVVLIVEPDSLPNMVTNSTVPACAVVAANNYYVDGITYAIQTLSTLPNTSFYLDIAHSGWLGWPAQMAKAIPLYLQVMNAATHNQPARIRGFATDIANYTPLVEPYVSPDNPAMLNSAFYQNNPVFDENTYVNTLNAQFKAAGLTQPLGFIIDTSRSGWPLINDGNPIDRRHARGNWCNVQNAGMGRLPVADPAGFAHVDAFYYVKPPGQSDGVSMLENSSNAPDAQGKRFDPSCAPATAANGLDGLPNAPDAGDWFMNDFLILLQNATPAL